MERKRLEWRVVTKSGQRWGLVWVLVVCPWGGLKGEEGMLLPQPLPGTLPDLKPPPGVEITRDAFEELMRKPFEDDLETPPWERKPAATTPDRGERVYRPEVVEDAGDAADMEVVRVPERVGDGVLLPPLRPPGPGQGSPELRELVFERNPYEARARAVEEGKFMMLAFVGTEWNSASRQLSWEVFNAPEFIEYADGNLVPCYLDYPQREASGDSALGRFKRHYGIGGLPAVVLFDPEGTPYVKKSGYMPKSGAAYLVELKVLVEERRRVLRERREKLESEGYRDWRNLEGRVFFGKVTKVEGGEVLFVDASGRPAKVALEKLSEDDRVRLGF